MADYIEIDASQLERDRQTIQSELDRIKTGIDQLRERMVNLGAMWEGPAHDVFMAQFQADYEYIQEFNSEIARYIETMEYARQEYEKCEIEVQQAIASVRI